MDPSKDRVPLQEALLMIHNGLERAMRLEQNFDETVAVALTEKDVGFLACALPSICVPYPEVADYTEELQHRLIELIQAQQPGWLKGETS